MRILHMLLAVVPVGGCAARRPDDAVTLSGQYIDASGTFSTYFHDGKCSGQVQGGELIETPCFMKGQLVYLKPGVSEGEHLSRNVWVVYESVGNCIQSHHIEDLDDGTRFYENLEPKVILCKQ